LPGKQTLNGEVLPSSVSIEVKAGNVLRMETPGGGGFQNTES
jgi:N-methylhydantoinase B/oxoprolinase/acetone carboxylase alpha subunit